MAWFETHRRDRETSVLGMWVFLATEIMLFGGLFTGFAAYWVVYTDTFRELGRHMLLEVAAANTAVLMTSSLTMALAVVFGRAGRHRQTSIALVVTALLGLAFLGLKSYEWHHEYTHYMLPLSERAFAFSGVPGATVFMSMYLIGTGLHFVHLTIGVALVGGETVRVARGGWRRSGELVGMYWHLVDVIWMFLFAVFYLVR